MGGKIRLRGREGLNKECDTVSSTMGTQRLKPEMQAECISNAGVAVESITSTMTREKATYPASDEDDEERMKGEWNHWKIR